MRRKQSSQCVFQIELICKLQRAGRFKPHPSGNRKRCGCFFIIRRRFGRGWKYLQLQQGEVGVAVVGLAFALLHDIVLEDARRFRVVPVEAVKDLLDMFRPLRREIKCRSHCGCVDAWPSRLWWVII
jgi:hypothetical protein